jgi:hypothetical protein
MYWYCSGYTVKKVTDFPVSSRDVTYQTLLLQLFIRAKGAPTDLKVFNETYGTKV